MQTAYSLQGLYKRIEGRQSQYEDRRSPVDKRRDLIVELLRSDLVRGQVGEKDEGGFECQSIVEGSGPHALRVWARGFRSNLISRKMPWFREKAKEPDPAFGVTFDGDDEVNRWQQDLADHMSAIYRRSNYYDVIGRFILDGGSVGSPVMLFQYHLPEDRIVCRVPDYASVWLDKNIFGEDNCLHVRHEYNALQAEEMFGYDQLPQAIQQQLRNGEHYSKTKYLQCIYGAGDRIYKDLPNGETVAQTHPWLEHFICESASGPQEEKVLIPLNQGPGYFARPFASWHTDRNDHEVYSKTMAWQAICDLQGNNAIWEALYGEAELALQPPILAMENWRGRLDFAPRGENYARNDQEYERPPMHIERNSGYQIGLDFADRLAANCRRHFHYDFFMAINQIIASKNQPETAFGLRRAQAENGIQLVEQIESAEQQVLGHTHDVLIAYERMAEPAYPWGRLPEPPEILQRYSDGQIDVEFIGPLSMMEINNRRVERFYRGLQLALGLADLDPMAAKYKIKWDEELENVLEAENFDQTSIRSQEQYEALLQDMEQKAIQQQLAENLPKLAQGAKALQGKTEKGSPLALLTGAA